MPLTSLTCPICLAVLKPKAPVPEGTRVRCPKCKGSFVAEGAPAEAQEDLAQEPMPDAADKPAEEEAAEVVEVVEEVTDTPKRRNRDDEDDRPRRKRARDDEEAEEDRPRKKKLTKGGLPMWAWFAIGGGGFVLLCGCCGIPGAIFAWRTLGGLSVNESNYNKIQGNMTESQVKAILGEPTDSIGFLGMQTETWSSGDYSIVVSFRNNRAIMKSCHLPFAGGMGTMDRAEPLGP